MTLSFDEVRRRMLSLYGQGAYQEAFTLVTQALRDLPDNADDLLYWSACMASRLGRAEEAVAALQQAAGAGYFYGDEFLQDQDLDAARQYPAFAHLTALFAQRVREAAAAGRPDLLVVPPAGPGPLLMAMHGNGERPDLEVEHWRPATDWGWLLAMPQSSQVTGYRRYHWNDLTTGVRELVAHQAALAARHRFDPARTVLGGFSRGGGLAMVAAMTGAVPACGFVVVAPYFTTEEIGPALAACPPGLRGVIYIGAGDGVSYDQVMTFASAAAERGLPIRVEDIAGLGHDYPEDFRTRLGQSLTAMG